MQYVDKDIKKKYLTSKDFIQIEPLYEKFQKIKDFFDVIVAFLFLLKINMN